VGEIRDVETALIAMQAAATGHLVLSTVHTNSAAATAHRLISMGVPPYLIAAASRLIISQRLVGLLCPHCKQEGDLTDAQACHLTPEERRLVAVACRPVGCPRCGGIGYSGRRAVFEVMPVLSHEMRQALVREASPDDLFGIAARDGMRSLRAKTVDLIAKGLTSVEEAASILSDVELRR